MDQNRPVHFALVAEVHGSTTVAQWRGALEAARHRHPLWSVFIDGCNGATPEFLTLEKNQVPLRVLRRERSQGWQEEVARELALPFRPRSGPLIRAVVIHSDVQSTLILVAHHSIADGTSLVYSIRDILRAISGQKLDTLEVHLSQEEALSIPRKFAAPRLSEKEAPPGNAAAITYRTSISSAPSVKSLRLSCEITTRLRQRARSEETTVHGAINAAIAIAARRVSDSWLGKELYVCSTVNNRKHIGRPEDCAVLFSAVNVVFHPEWPLAFWDLARRAKDVVFKGQTLGRCHWRAECDL
jgi:hypothetical protein